MNQLSLERRDENLNRFHVALASDDGKAALSYLKSRGISSEVIFKFKLGWCGRFDPNIYMRGRITVPLKTIYGETLCFAGRIPTIQHSDGTIVSAYDGELVECVSDGKKRRNKLTWWHEPLAKRNFLYGLDQSWKYIRKENAVIVVEGEFDLWACYQAGLKNVVGILGSAFTVYHLGKLLGLCNNVIMMLDGDNGGETGWQKSFELYCKFKQGSYLDFNVNRIMLPQGHDPFSFIKEYGISPIIQSYNKIKKNHMEI